VGQELGRYLFSSSVVALMGGLGSGKTTLVQGMARGLEVSLPVRSPSFVLIREYAGRLPLYHFDLYRITQDKEILNLGYEEYFYQKGGVVVIEWADRIKRYLPPEYLGISMSIVNTSSRRIAFWPRGTLYQQIVKKMEDYLKREI
jgi:tRNA threonylcarbamoyladenosine biosynthesis protein TsaE